MIELSFSQIAPDLMEMIDQDKDKILERLPGIQNSHIRVYRFLHRFSGRLEEATKSVRNGDVIEIQSTPIGEAYDVTGGWGKAELRNYVKSLQSEGYYRDYMRLKRAGTIGSGKFYKKGIMSGQSVLVGTKRLPLMVGVVNATGKYIRQIIGGEDES